MTEQLEPVDPEVARSNLIPSNIRLFAQHLAGRTDPVTENDFSKEDLAVMRQAVAEKIAATKQLKGSVGYLDFGNTMGLPQYNMGNASPVDMAVSSWTSAPYRVIMSLGTAHYTTDAENNVYLEDRYNFNATRQQVDSLLAQKGGTLGALAERYKQRGWPGVVEALGNIFGATDDEPGIPVKIRVGKLSR